MLGYKIREEMNDISEAPGKTWFWELEAGVIDADRCIQCGSQPDFHHIGSSDVDCHAGGDDGGDSAKAEYDCNGPFASLDELTQRDGDCSNHIEYAGFFQDHPFSSHGHTLPVFR